jgi:hypothetical protein
MLIAYDAVGSLTAAAIGLIATLGFLRSPWVVENMTSVGLEPSSVYPLGLLKTAGAVGLLVGIALPALGVAAAIGLVLFFIGAITAHVRAREFATIPFPGMFLVLAVASLVLRAGAL